MMKCDKCGKNLVGQYLVATEFDTDKQYVCCDMHCFDDLANFLDLNESHIEIVDIPMTKSMLMELIDKYEGFSDTDITEAELLFLFSYLIKTGAIWSLQGYYQREMDYLIEAEYLDELGNIL